MDLHFAWTKTSEGQLNWASQPGWKHGWMPNRDRTQEVSLKTGTQYRGDLQSLDKKVKINEYINIVHVVYVTEMSVLSVCTL